jgi:hypothetical protein
MGSFFKECEHARSRWSKCPHPYKIRYRSTTGRQAEESGFETQDGAIRRLLEIYNEKKAAPQSQSKAERIRTYGAMPFEEYLEGLRSRGAGHGLGHGALSSRGLENPHRRADAWQLTQAGSGTLLPAIEYALKGQRVGSRALGWPLRPRRSADGEALA